MGIIDLLFGDDARILRQVDFQVLLLATIPYPLGISVISPILDTLTGPFGVSAATIGVMVTAFFAPAIVVTPLAGSIADRYGRKSPLVVGLLLLGVCGTAIAATTDFRIALALRVLQGIGAGVVLPVLVTSIGDLYAEDEEATAQGIRTATHALSGAVAPVVAGVLVVIAWQYPFFLYALAVPIAFAVVLFFEEPANTLDSRGDGWSRVRDLLALTRRPHVLAPVLAFAIPPFLYVAFLTYNSFIVIRGIGGSPQQAGFLAAIGNVAIAVAASQAGRVTAAFGTRIRPILAAHIALGVGLVAIATAPVLPVAAVGVGFLGFGFGLSLALYRSLLTELAPGHLRGGLVSIGETSRGIGATAAPLVIGGLIEVTHPLLGQTRSVQWMNAAVGALGLVAGIVLVLITRTGLASERTRP